MVITARGNRSTTSRFAQLTVAIGIAAMLVGALVLLGWAMDIEPLRAMVPGYAAMNPMTASAFILAGISLGLQSRPADASGIPGGDVSRWISKVSAAIVLGFGLLVCGNFFLDGQLEVDRLLFSGQLAYEDAEISSKTVAGSGLSFVFVGFALLFLDVTSRHGIRPAEILAIAVMCLSLFGIEGYFYDIRDYHAFKSLTPMALQTALTFGMLAFGLFCARPRVGLMTLATDDFPGAILLTRGFPLIAITVVLAGWLRFEGENLGYYTGAMGVALYTLISVVIIGVLLIWSVKMMRDMEVNRLKSVQERNRFFDLTRDLVCVASTDGFFRHVNAAFTTTLGYTRDELLSRPFVDFVHPEDRSETLNEVRRLGAGQGAANFVNRYSCKDGSWRVLSWSTSAFPEEGKLYASARDITDFMAVQNALHTREEELSITLQSIGDAVLSTDIEGRVTRLNAMAQYLTGWAEGEAIGLPVDTVFRIINEQTRLPAVNPIAETMATGTIRELENHTLLLTRDGRELPIADSCAPKRNRAGTVVGAVLTFRDVSESRRAALELEVAHAFAQSEGDRLKMVLDAVVDGVIGINDSGQIQAFNSAAEQLYGYSSEEVIGQNISMLAPQAIRDKLEDYFNNYHETRPNRIIDLGREVTGLRKDGSVFPMELSVVETDSEDDWKFTCVVRDVSERTRFITELQSAREQADAANAAKSAFLATMSHEIRTPMNGVIGMLDVLHQTSLKGYQVEMVDLIQDSAESLLTIINDILDFSKIEAGKLEVYNTPFDVAASVENVCVMMDRFAEKSRVDLLIFIDPSCPRKLQGDGQHLRQVLINLISNAVKFSSERVDHKGNVSLRMECVQFDADEITIEFQVRDNGIGMDMDTQAKLFMPFEQGKPSISRRFGGTGLGLAISHNLTQMMGGDIRAVSELGKGSTFIVSLPFGRVTESPDRQGEFADLTGLSCLVIGKAEGLAPDMAIYLAHGGARVEHIDTLELAREWVRDRKEEKWVWVIDAGNSHPTVAEIETVVGVGSEWEASFLAVVIERGKRHNLRRKGDGVYMVDGNALCRRTLLMAVAVAAGRQSLETTFPTIDATFSDESRPISREAAIQQGRLILVAEDNETNQKVIVKQLALLGVAADVASNGVDALERWRMGSYRMLLTDLHMPSMDGFELTAAIRAEERDGAHVGIVALTANALPGEAEHCRLLGIDDYLSKPASLENIKNVLNKWLPPLAVEVAELPAVEANKPPLSPPVSAPRAVGAPVDIRVLQELLGGDAAMLREFIEDFRRSATDISAQMHAAWQSGAFPDVGAKAHMLKSSARTVGAMALGDRCENIETAVNEGQVTALRELLVLFDQAFVAVNQYLESH